LTQLKENSCTKCPQSPEPRGDRAFFLVLRVSGGERGRDRAFLLGFEAPRDRAKKSKKYSEKLKQNPSPCNIRV